ncbi:MAG TPA: helix-turn-helix transcriptional regulator [Candidatus Binatia bacterium]|nr:helix-turn-helix transcriptional regulator [Candidatus Binatia bacterium]
MRRLRDDRGWSLRELARKARVSQPQIGTIERGGDPKLSTLNRLARALGSPLDHLFAEVVGSRPLHRQSGRAIRGAARTVEEASKALDEALALRENYRPQYERSFAAPTPPGALEGVERAIRRAIADIVRLKPIALCTDPRVRQFLERAVQVQSDPEDRRALGAALASGRGWDRRLARGFPEVERTYRERFKHYMRTGRWPPWSDDEMRRRIRRYQRARIFSTDEDAERQRRESLEPKSGGISKK